MPTDNSSPISVAITGQFDAAFARHARNLMYGIDALGSDSGEPVCGIRYERGNVGMGHDDSPHVVVIQSGSARSTQPLYGSCAGTSGLSVAIVSFSIATNKQ